MPLQLCVLWLHLRIYHSLPPLSPAPSLSFSSHLLPDMQVEGQKVGLWKDARVWWNALITFSNSYSSCHYNWIARGSGGSIVCYCSGLGMCCMYFLNQVMYDAAGIRLHAGRQAELLNQIMCELPPEHPVANVKPLRDSLGHTPPQIAAGALLGSLIAFLLQTIA